jgi:hypothetical protein
MAVRRPHQMAHSSTLADDLIAHPDLIPLLHLAPDGTVVCFGWVSPIYEFDKSIFEAPEKYE